MHVPFFPLAAIGNLDAEAVSYQFIGMLVVFCCLGLLSIILTISGSVAVRMEAKRIARQAAAKAALTSSAAASSPTPSEPSPQQIAALAAGIYNTAASSITPELVAAIAAAVKYTVGSDARILSIQPVGSSYAQSGRSSIMNSHLPLHG